MIAVREQPAVGQKIRAAMLERKTAAAQRECGEHGVMGDGAKDQDCLDAVELRELGRQKRRQVAISAAAGLFCGGTQRTALAIRARRSTRPSSGRAA